MLAGHRRMRYLVGKTSPGGSSRKVNRLLGYRALVVGVLFHGVVELQHVVVILRAKAMGQPEPAEKLALQPARRRQACPEPFGHLRKRLANPPGPRSALGIDVAEQPQD